MTEEMMSMADQGVRAMTTIAHWPEWTEAQEVRGRSAGVTRTAYHTFLPEGVPGEPNSHQIHIVCCRIVVNPRMPKYDRRRYRFEWRAKVWDHDRDALLGDGHLLDPSCVGPTSDACKRAVAQYLARATKKEYVR